MLENPDEKLTRTVQKRLSLFLDCVAYLLAKSLLHEQRAAEERLGENAKSNDDPVDDSA